MFGKLHILFLSGLCISITPVAMAAPGAETHARPAPTAQSAPLPQEKLNAMSNPQLLKLGQRALDAEVETQDFVTGLNAAKVAMSRGDRDATRLMAKIMARHQVVLDGIDRVRLERRLRFEAMRGASSSVLAVAIMHDRGEGVPVDTKKAAEWYLWAARLGHERAMAHMAYAYGAGRGLERNEADALKWLEGLNEGRRRSTLVEMGWALLLGTEGVTDEAGALRFFERAAELQSGAAYQVALELERGTRGVQNREMADRLIRYAAERGDSSAATRLAQSLSRSSSVEDQRLAIRWYAAAAQDKDNAVAGQSLSRLLTVRPAGALVPELVSALESAARAGNLEAILGMAHAYAEGIGVDASPEKAAGLLQQAADSGLPEAQYRLGLMYKSGLGVPVNLAKAMALMSSARQSGYPLAAVALSSMMEPAAESPATDRDRAEGRLNPDGKQ